MVQTAPLSYRPRHALAFVIPPAWWSLSFLDLLSFGVGLIRLRLASLSAVLWVGASIVLLFL